MFVGFNGQKCNQCGVIKYAQADLTLGKETGLLLKGLDVLYYVTMVGQRDEEARV